MANAIVQGGLGVRAAQDYDEQQGARGFAERARAHGVKVMESDERRRAAADTLIDQKTAIEKLRGDIEQNELSFQQTHQPTDQAMRASDLQHRAAMQPGQQSGERETQNIALSELREKQAGNLWGLLSVGDKAGTLELLNKSQLLHPGRKFSDIQRGSVPVRGNDGQPLTDGGKPVTEEVIRLVPSDGGEDVFVPVKTLEDNARKHGNRYEKVGNNMIRIDRQGQVTPVYAPDEFAANTETGDIFSKRTGEVKPRTGAPAAAGGVRPPRKVETHEDQRVKDGKGVVDRYFGISEFTGLNPANQPKYNRIIGLMGQKVRAGMDPEAAATAAINEINHADAALANSGRPGGGAAYSGPTPWRR